DRPDLSMSASVTTVIPSKRAGGELVEEPPFLGGWSPTPKHGGPSTRSHSLGMALLASLCLTATPAHAQAPNGGNGTIYVGTYAKKILVIDEATMAVKDSMPVSVGIPLGLGLSKNRRHFYVL